MEPFHEQDTAEGWQAGLGGARPRQRADVLAQEMFDEMVLYDPRQEMAFSLNVSARAVWELCDGARTVAEICRELARVLEVDPAALAPDVKDAVLSLQRMNLLELDENAAHPG